MWSIQTHESKAYPVYFLSFLDVKLIKSDLDMQYWNVCQKCRKKCHFFRYFQWNTYQNERSVKKVLLQNVHHVVIYQSALDAKIVSFVISSEYQFDQFEILSPKCHNFISCAGFLPCLRRHHYQLIILLYGCRWAPRAVVVTVLKQRKHDHK